MIKRFVEKITLKSTDLYQKSVTIAFLGDSVTQGCFELYKIGENGLQTEFDSGNSYSSKLKKIFSTLYPNVSVNIINSGISGDNALSGYNRLDRDIIAYNPDLVVVCFGLNDCSLGLEQIERYTSSLQNIFKKLKEKDIDSIFMTPNMMDTKLSPHLTDKLFIEVATNCMNLQNEGVLDKYITKAKEIALAEGAAVCDCYSKWQALSNNGVDTTELLSNYINHPTREMHWLFAYSLFEKIMLN